METMFISLAYASLVGVFTLVAFNIGVAVGRDTIVIEAVEEESEVQEIKPGKVYTIATDDEQEDETENWDGLDEAQKVEKIRQRIEDERVNKFFD